MAIKKVTKAAWPELRQFLIKDGYRFCVEHIEEAWKKEDQLHEMIYKLTHELNHLRTKFGISNE